MLVPHPFVQSSWNLGQCCKIRQTGTQPGHRAKFRDCPGQTGTLGNYDDVDKCCVLKHAYCDRLGKQNYTCIGWVHRCMDWVQIRTHMHPLATPLEPSLVPSPKKGERVWWKGLHYHVPTSIRLQ